MNTHIKYNIIAPIVLYQILYIFKFNILVNFDLTSLCIKYTPKLQLDILDIILDVI